MAITDFMLAGGIFAAMGTAILIVGILIYVYFALALMTMAKRLKTPNAWLAWIPIANFYLITQMAKQDGLWTLAILLSLIPMVGPILLLVVTIWFMWIIVERIKFPGWTSLLLIIPVVNIIMWGVWAWYKK